MNGSGNPMADFRDAMRQAGLEPRGEIVADGRLHRFVPEGRTRGGKSAFYVYHMDGDRPAGAFGDWRTGEKHTFCNGHGSLSRDELRRLNAKVTADKKRREGEEKERQARAAALATQRLAASIPAAIDHPYLARKKIGPNGLTQRSGSGMLMVPLRDIGGTVWSLQTIDDAGHKLFLPGGRIAACFHMIGEPGDVIIIGEGFATMATIHEATGYAAVAAMNCGNLAGVARAIRTKYQDARLVIAADDDHATDGNPGLSKGRHAAEAVGALMAAPSFADQNQRGTDFNDLHVIEGLDGVREQIEAALAEPMPEPPPSAEATDIIHAGEDQPSWKEVLAEGIAELNGRHCVLAIGGSVRIATATHEAELGRDRLVFSSERDIRLLYAHRHVPVRFSRRTNELVYEGLGAAWLSDYRRRTYTGVGWYIDREPPEGILNLWRGFGVDPRPGASTTIEAHLHRVICRGHDEHFAWLVQWMAFCVQNPSKPAETAVVIRGLKGTGKGMVAQILMRIFRHHAVHISHSRHLVGNFNAHLVDAAVLFLDEAFWAGDKSGEGVLKTLITERTLMIEPKGVDSFQVPNRLKILIASNNDWVVPVSADERRFFCLEASDVRKGDRTYFAKLAAAIEGDELAGFLHKLLTLDISDFDHRNPPHTEELNRQKVIGGDSFTRYWHDCLSAGELIGTGESDWPRDIPCSVLHQAYIQHAHDHGDRHPLPDDRMAIRLKDLSGWATVRKCRPERPYGEMTRPRRYALDSLGKHRAAFGVVMKLAADHPWPEVAP